MKKALCITAVALALSGCATWTTSNVQGEAQVGVAATKTPIDRIFVTEADIRDRPYQTLGDVEVSVNKTTIFHPDPTPALVNAALREKAFELGADAVVLVQYGQVGISLFSWGTLQGKGRAIRYTQ